MIAAFFSIRYYYKERLPQAVADAIVKDEYPAIVPEKVVKKIKVASKEVNTRLETVITTTETQGITIDQLIQAVDEVKEDEVRKTLDILYNTDLRSADQLFDIGIENIHIQAFDPAVLRESFVNNVKMKKVEKALKYIKDNELADALSPDVARETIKRMILTKQEEIIARTSVEGNVN